MAGFTVVPPGAAQPGGFLNPVAVPFWSNGTPTGPDYAPNPWDTVVFAGLRFPGVCKLKNVKIAKIEVDKKKPKGGNGKRLTLLGYSPDSFDVTCLVWTQSQFGILLGVIQKIWHPPLKKSKISEGAAEIRHPGLASVNVFQAALVGVSPPDDGPYPQSKVYTFSFYENVLPDGKNVTKTVRAAVGVDPVFQYTPENAAPEAPSANKANMSLVGPPPAPHGGTS